jgi:30S ribosomal protein S31
MGRGDKKTKKGKIWKGSYGNSRKRAVNKVKFTPVAKASEDTEAKPKPKVKKAVKKKAKPADK